MHACAANWQGEHESRDWQLERKIEGKQEGRKYPLASIKETVEYNEVSGFKEVGPVI